MNDSFRQAVGDFPRIPLTLRPESTAVLLIDVQNDFCAPEGIYARNGLECPGIPALLGPLAEFLAASKQSGARLINVRTEYACGPDGAPVEAGLHIESRPFLKEDGLRPGSWGARTVEGEGFSGFDLEIVKVRFSSFFGTDLEERLRALNIETVILTGVYTNYCVQATAFDAYQRNFRVVMAHDMMTTWDAEVHTGVLKGLSGFTNVLSAREILDGLLAAEAVRS
jgi:ureidoacrylate peracid hydrolase